MVMVSGEMLGFISFNPTYRAANSGNLALLMLAGKLKLITSELAEATSNCYRTLRALQHKMRLNNQSPCRVDREAIDVTSVITLWEELMGPHAQEKQ